jgi:HEAT repeat protein
LPHDPTNFEDDEMKALALDERLRALLNHEGYDPKELVALGRPALQRVLLAVEREAPLTLPSKTSELDGRAYEDGLQAALAAFAADDLQGVLTELKARQWSDERIALSGLARVKDERIVPFLLAAYASKEPMTRLSAVNYLGLQRDPRATDTLVKALTDRSSQVRSAAVEALGEVGDARAIKALKALAANKARQGLSKTRPK